MFTVVIQPKHLMVFLCIISLCVFMAKVTAKQQTVVINFVSLIYYPKSGNFDLELKVGFIFLYQRSKQQNH